MQVSAATYIRRQRSSWLTAWAFGARTPLVAAIGRMDPLDLRALAAGVSKTLACFGEKREQAVIWYHYLRDPAVAPRARRLEPVMAAIGERSVGLVHQVGANGDDRRAWEKDVATRLLGSPRRWGLVVLSAHYNRAEPGVDTRAAAEFDVMLPLMDEHTMVVLMGVNKDRGYRQLARMWHKGWKGNVIERMRMAVLSLQPMPNRSERCQPSQ